MSIITLIKNICFHKIGMSVPLNNMLVFKVISNIPFIGKNAAISTT